MFSYFLFFFLQHKKDKHKKRIFFEYPFLTPWQIAKRIFSHPYTLFVFFKITPKHYRFGENKQNKILDQVLTQPWTKFRLKKQNLGPSFDSIYIYIHIYLFICRRICRRPGISGQNMPYFVCLFHERKRARLHLRGTQNPNQSLLAWQLQETQDSWWFLMPVLQNYSMGLNVTSSKWILLWNCLGSLSYRPASPNSGARKMAQKADHPPSLA